MSNKRLPILHLVIPHCVIETAQVAIHDRSECSRPLVSRPLASIYGRRSRHYWPILVFGWALLYGFDCRCLLRRIISSLPRAMSRKLYLLLNNPEETTFVSSAGIALYQVSTSKSRILRRPTVLRIRRPADEESRRVVAEVKWSRWPGLPSIVRSNVLGGKSQQLQIKKFLFKLGSNGSHFSW